jgi:hypothetical protein
MVSGEEGVPSLGGVEAVETALDGGVEDAPAVDGGGAAAAAGRGHEPEVATP